MAYSRTHNLFGSFFCGMEMAQYWADLPLWENLLNEHREIKTLIEMGTYKCGMSVFLKAQCIARQMRFWTFDRKRPEELNNPVVRALGIDEDFVLGDFFADRKDKLVGLLSWSEIKPLLLFVDGSNKPLELETFVPYLAAGDYAAVHDYGTEFQPGAEEPVADLLERVYWQECEAPPQPCLTRFWRRR
ncbi:MAG TPA: hypothetical protein VM537_19945 [Anaerolineae bacterium]|nr:hypothetical protein [Anaerolineae bacterium]